MFIGLPSSGKTSFIGALWHVVLSGEIESAFSVIVQPENREYLNLLRNCFLECEAPERTKIEFEKKIELNIRDNKTGKTVDFIFPDLSGETYESQFEYRKLSVDYVNQISESNSLMLFINPDFIKKAHMISHAIAMFDNMEDDNNDADHGLIDKVEWKPKMCQTQVVLVDLVQMIMNKIRKPCKVGIVISAWDVIKNLPDKTESEISPSEWLQAHLPLLKQYLSANKQTFHYEVFGVSAQGGKYDEKKDNTRLQSLIKQSERIIVQVGNTTSHDITIPIRWLFNS
ncbi:hypothetical protein Q0590_34065 [Rhodocytophaga aerolata]|uniref:Double-GTPase 1 domain-containing protein n=1 Tax=Rhodocytophaga aerolata TaxID=455078 RepID=A0ABT8RGW9_9BACT|nr:hypothetical protein [Rhodocytophaga aerolata]MDO1451351.1 hypothetical protein [Rhodocytophaga aerolata]